MDAHTLLHTRRTTHAFAPATLPDAVLDRALAAAHQAPCHKLTWPWRFRVPGPATRARLVEAGVAMQGAKGAPESVSRPMLEKKLLVPAAVVVVSQVVAEDPFRAREDYAACACAVQNLMLSLHADGWATKWGTGALTRDPGALDVLGVDAETEEVVGWVYVGQPASDAPVVARPPVASVVTRLP